MYTKPKVITKAVASHYERPNERIIEYSFGGDGKGGAIGGLICFSIVDGKPIVELYRHDPEVDIRVGSAS